MNHSDLVFIENFKHLNDSEICFAVGDCLLGKILVAVYKRGVCFVSMGDDTESLHRGLTEKFSAAEIENNVALVNPLLASVINFIANPLQTNCFPLDTGGTVFQQQVWRAIQAIPLGTTVSYSDIAQNTSSPNSPRAVAGACAANSLAIIIPCHRVVHRDGSLSGYRWGIERKKRLLEIEKSSLFKTS